MPNKSTTAAQLARVAAELVDIAESLLAESESDAPPVEPAPVVEQEEEQKQKQKPKQKPKADPEPDPEPVPSLAFAALEKAKDIVIVDGLIVDKYEAESAPGRVFDARGSESITDNIRHAAIELEGADEGMVWCGGYGHSNRPHDASWADHKATERKDDPSRNSSDFGNRAPRATLSGRHAFNIGDGFRMNDATDWRIQHCWLEYVRDDAIENDNLGAGTIFDTLIDGTYTGISNRPSSSNKSSDGRNNVVTLDHVLMRLEMQPWPYKYRSKSGVLDYEGNEYAGRGIAYGHGSFFKYEDDEDELPGRNVRYRIVDSVFLAAHPIAGYKVSMPHESLIDECRGNFMIWLGPDEFPADLPDGVSLITGEEGRELWRAKVSDWHARHPDVGTHRKPARPGEIVFPVVF